MAGGDGRGGAAIEGVVRQVIRFRLVSYILTDAGIATGYRTKYDMML